MFKILLLNLLLMGSPDDTINSNYYYDAVGIIKNDIYEYFNSEKGEVNFILRKKYHIDDSNKIKFCVSNLLFNLLPYSLNYLSYLNFKYPDTADTLIIQMYYDILDKQEQEGLHVVDSNFASYNNCSCGDCNVIIFFSKVQEGNVFAADVFPYFKKFKSIRNYYFLLNEELVYLFVMDKNNRIDTVFPGHLIK